MSTEMSTADRDEDILDEFTAALFAGDRAAVEAYFRDYPHLAERFRVLAEARGLLPEGIPARLGDFRPVRCVAAGGMGEVHEAVQLSLNRRVALKVIRQGQATPPMRARFLREQLLLARLLHTHLCPIHFAGAEGAVQYLVMPFIDGANLRQIAARARDVVLSGRPLPPLGELARQPAGGEAAGQTAKLDAGEKVALSAGYLRSAVKVLADAADAVGHAHRAKVLHRDVKPSNVMVDTAGECKVIDFGLGALVGASCPEEGGGAAQSDDEKTLTTTGFLGTPPYAAPEQHRHRVADERSDVWGLGVTLYEVLTLQPAFASGAEVLSKVPDPPGKLVRRLPADLDSVCRKAMEPDPERRYASADELAADLRRWLDDLPVSARRRPWRERLRRWAVRNPLLAVLGVVALASALSLGLTERRRLREQIEAVEQRERDQTEAAQERERVLQRQNALQRLQGFLLRPHEAGWSLEAWRLAAEAAALERGIDVRDLAARSLAGIDVTVSLYRGESSSVAFDASGRLLAGGVGDSVHSPARLFNPGGKELARGLAADGPVAFAPDGTALQLVIDPRDRYSLVLWDVDRGRAVRRFEVSGAGRQDGDMRTALALTPDGAFAAGAVSAGLGGWVGVWETKAGRRVWASPSPATAVALSPDGCLVALGAPDGSVAVWPTAGGKEIAIPGKGTPVTCLAFHRDVRRRLDGSEPGWLLAVGDRGGTATVWDLAGRAEERAHCPGSPYGVYAVAFSPDNCTLATAGLGEVRLWDTATRRPLVRVAAGEVISGLAFSADGRRLAVGTRGRFGSPVTTVCELQNGRGVRTFRGLLGPVDRVTCWDNGGRLAGLGHDWKLAVWDGRRGRLMHLFDVPIGLTADNAGLAFSPDGNQLAFAAGSWAALFDLSTGRVVRKTGLPRGKCDGVAFGPKGEVFIVRVEDRPWGANPRGRSSLVRVRNLLGPDPKEDLWPAIDLLDAGVYTARIAPDGRYFALIGRTARRERGFLVVYETVTGKLLWEREYKPHGTSWAPLHRDPTGATLAYKPDMRLNSLQVMQEDGQPVRTLALGVSALSTSDHAYALCTGERGEERILVCDPARSEPVVGLRGTASLAHEVHFTLDPNVLFWGCNDGSVAVADLAGVNRQLGELGLGWSR